uniref:Alpha-2-macroglobulin-like n=1 Tax=Cyprinus carpio carpio TaxID=630221 RepID=A0A9J7XFP9_CYPCA
MAMKMSMKVMFKVPVRARMAPKMEFLVYCVPPSEIVLAASRTFQIEKCFENKVSLRFSPTTAVPGEENILQISAQPGSLCGLSAVDQSVRILEPRKHLDAEKIFKLFPIRLFPIDIEDEEDCFNVRSIRNPRYLPPSPPYRSHRQFSPYYYPSKRTADAVYNTFRNMGLKVATNLIIRMPSCIKVKDVVYHRTEMCNSYGFMDFGCPQAYPDAKPGVVGMPGPVGPMGPMGPPGPMGPMGPGGSARGTGIENTPLIPEETIRTFFPETWIWELVEMGDSGSAQVPVTVPDTITSWETEAFCLSSKGLGLAPPAKLTVFQPFFLELSLPYSIIRGEIFELKATVFNYLSKCIMDTVVALQALSLYATKVFSSDGSSTVTVQSAADTHHFDVNQHNKLLYQEKQLQNVPAKYSIEVKGSTCVSVQMSLFYNIPTPKDSKALQIFARTGGLCQSRTGQILDVVLDIIF